MNKAGWSKYRRFRLALSSYNIYFYFYEVKFKRVKRFRGSMKFTFTSCENKAKQYNSEFTQPKSSHFRNFKQINGERLLTESSRPPKLPQYSNRILKDNVKWTALRRID